MANATESALRRPDFRPGIPVELADGQVWHLPRVRLTRRLHIGPEGGLRLVRSAEDAPPGWLDALARLEALADDDLAYLEWLAGMGLALLHRNYDVPDELAPELFALVEGDGASLLRWAALRLAVLGRALPDVDAAPADDTPEPGPAVGPRLLA